MMEDAEITFIFGLAARLQQKVEDVERAFNTAARNVRTVLRRQNLNTINPVPDRPLCKFLGEQQLMKSLGALPSEVALFTLARIYDEAHVALCKTITAARTGTPHNEGFMRNPLIDLSLLTDQLNQARKAVEDQIILEASRDNDTPLTPVFQPIQFMSFDRLPRLSSLSALLPGERSPSAEYAGIGGRGLDVISASLLGLLLQRQHKRMDLLISTRSWATESQSKNGSKIRVKREVYNHGGPAVEVHGRPVAGTFRVTADTQAGGRDLEAIPLRHHAQIFIVLDQGESRSEILEYDKADLTDQFNAILSQAKHHIDTVLITDTGGDVFGADRSGGTTPDQDYRVQKAMSMLSHNYNLITAIVAPGVSSPNDTPEKAFEAGGMVYKPTEEEKRMLLDILATQYRMDGSDPSRFSKALLALQARLRGVVGWTSLDLPAYVVDTWDNPQRSFVYVRECISDIILMPTTNLLPLIEPLEAKGTNSSAFVEPLEGEGTNLSHSVGRLPGHYVDFVDPLKQYDLEARTYAPPSEPMLLRPGDSPLVASDNAPVNPADSSLHSRSIQTNTNVMAFWNAILPEAMVVLRLTQEPNDRPETPYSIRDKDDWDDVRNVLEAAQTQYRQGRGSMNNWLRRTRGKATSNMVSDNLYGTPILGVVEVILYAISTITSGRQEMPKGFDDLIAILSEVELFMATSPNDVNNWNAAVDLTVMILDAVEQAIGFFLSNSPLKLVKALVMGNHYEASLLEKVNMINTKSKILMEEAVKSGVDQIFMSSEETQEIQLRLGGEGEDIANSKVSLAHLLDDDDVKQKRRELRAEPLEGERYSSTAQRRMERGLLDLWIAIEPKRRS